MDAKETGDTFDIVIDKMTPNISVTRIEAQVLVMDENIMTCIARFVPK